MSLDPSEFAAFFMAVNNGNRPFAWQQRLFDYLVAHGEWPEAINAPTGTGKSNVVDVHIFANALCGWGAPIQAPRRLAVVVNRRSLVDAHEDRAAEVISLLEAADRQSLLGRVAEGLGRLRRQAESGSNVVLARIRGGAALDSTWIDDPTACTVICATPDMWGSRLLFHGYGTSRLARPREAGVLAYDSVMILDEAHLNLQLMRTATRTAELLARYPAPATPLQVVSTTATQASTGGGAIGVEDADIENDRVLRRRLTRPKPVTYVGSPNWQPKRVIDKYIDDIVEAVIAMSNDSPDGTIGCVVNRVDTAVKVAAKLKNRLAGLRRGKVLTWVGPMRRLDLLRYKTDHKGVFTPAGNAEVGVVVATQTIEVGVNVDFAGMVTELASGTALAQRAGRVNRIGDRDSGPVAVIGPEGPPTADPRPYSAKELIEARSWVLDRAEDPSGLSPQALREAPAPAARRQRDVLCRLEQGDVFALSPTSESRPARPELDLWLHDSLESNIPHCGIALRGGKLDGHGRPLPVDSLDALALLRATPPDPVEIFPTPLYRAQNICTALREGSQEHSRAFRYHDGIVDVIDLTAKDLDLAAGDILILDADHGIVREHTIVDYGEGEPEQYTVWGPVTSESGEEVRLLWRDDDPSLFTDLDAVARGEESDEHEHEEDEVASLTARQQTALENHGYQGFQVTVGGPLANDDEPRIPWLVIRPNRSGRDNEATRQTWTGPEAVSLDQHATAVAARAGEISFAVGLSPATRRVLELAGLHHDDGKRDPRFQRMLGGTVEAPLAKSGGPSSRRTTTAKTRTGLPPGWRHEQLSVACTQVAAPEVDDPELLLRLIGTSHGWGRSGFPHNGDELVHPHADDALRAAARELFSVGAWEELVEATDRAHGPWACAYYEALLRAADCGVSKEGS